MDMFDNTVLAYLPFEENLEWNSARGPSRGSFTGTVLHGQSQSSSAGASRGTIAADPWTIIVGHEVAIVTDIKVGDVIKRIDRYDQVLNVQQITRDRDLGWILVCTANERSPK